MRSLYLRYRRRAMQGLLLCGLLSRTGLGLAHGSASIDARLEHRADGAELRLRMSLRDLRHLVEVDRDGDGQMTPDEVLAVRADLERELQQALRLVPEQGEIVCTSTLTGLALADLASVDVALRFHCGQTLRAAQLHSGLFAGSGHGYSLTLQLVDGVAADRVVLTRERNRVLLPAPRTRSGSRGLWASAGVALAIALALAWRWRAPRRP